MKKPELLAPGGSFAAAYHALEAGADGIYLGLKEFSARAAASNFSLEQLRRIRQFAADRGRRIYVTVNTLVRDEEGDRLRRSLDWLEALRVDGVIVQDLGVCDLVRREFPGLVLHASTQMGIHNDSGLEAARELGVRRVILARELPLERIRALRERHPDMELEVFIHGALCYSFSGSCLASWALTGRSANRGECAQICRSRFVPDTAGESGVAERAGPGHLFSTRDLFAGRDALDLARAGVDALKIEGRMKSPEYVRAATHLYRELLDRGDDLSDARLRELARDAELGFSRPTTSGWLRSWRGTDLVETGAPGHRGAVLGTVREVKGRLAELRLEGDLSRRDGAGWLLRAGGEMAAFSVHSILRAGRPVTFARRGEVVQIDVPRDASPGMPVAGQEMRHLSSRSRDLPQPREASFPLYQIPVDLDVRVDAAGMFQFRTAGFSEFIGTVTVSGARRPRPFPAILSALLRESGVSVFRPGNISFTNESGRAEDEIFVRPAELKRLKNDFYAHLARAFEDRAAGRSRVVNPDPVDSMPSPLDPAVLSRLRHRQVLSPAAQAPVPFVAGDPETLRIDALAEIGGFRWLPLPPVVMDDAAWIAAVRRLARRHADVRIAVGLNNVSHLAFARALQADGNVWFFADFFLYAANEGTTRLLAEKVPRLLFAYHWVEAPEGAAPGSGPAPAAAASGPVPTVRLSDDFDPPLFYSLGCFIRHAVNGGGEHRAGSCDDDCRRDFTGELRQGRNRFRLVVRDCVTYLFRAR